MLKKQDPAAVVCELIRKGNFLQAVHLAGENLDYSDNPELRKSMALALSRMGYTDQAMERLKPLLKGDGGDAETQALMGGILKRQWDVTGDDDLLRKSYERYLRAFREDRGYWAGINAATLARVMGMDTALPLAEEVLNICWDEYSRMGTRSSFWLLVSIAEAHLVKGDLKTAEKWYKLVTPMAFKSAGQVKTVRRNARLLGELFGEDELQNLMKTIYSPKIAFFAGHRIDRDGMPLRFPQIESENVKAKLRSELGKMKISVGVASLADGADILFHECLIDSGRQSRVVLPYPLREFRERLEADDPGGWLPRFDRVIDNASAIETVTRSVFTKDWSAVHELATNFMLGYAINLAEEFDGEMIPIVVWDKKSSTRKGGTSEAVKTLKGLGYEPVVISVFPDSSVTDTYSYDVQDLPNSSYVPNISIVIVIGLGTSIRNDDLIADKISLYIKTIADVSTSKKDSPVKRIISGKEIGLLFREMSPALEFISKFAGSHPDACLAVHAGFSIRFEVALSQTGDIYSPALEEAVVLARKLSSGQIFATIAFRSLAYLEENCCFSFVYRGLYEPDHTSIELFEMIPENRMKNS